jgi:hypothetical protein
MTIVKEILFLTHKILSVIYMCSISELSLIIITFPYYIFKLPYLAARRQHRVYWTQGTSYAAKYRKLV